MTNSDDNIGVLDQQQNAKYFNLSYPQGVDEETISDSISRLRTSDAYLKQLDERTIPIDLNRVFPYQPMYDNKITDNTVHYESVLRGIFSESILSRLFFSTENINNVDKQLRYQVYLLSNNQYRLGPQDKAEIVIIMRSVYLNYAQNLSNNDPSIITEQIRRLNNIVIEQTAPRLLSNATQYLYYLRDANEIHKIILPQPLNVSNKGTKLLKVATGLGF